MAAEVRIGTTGATGKLRNGWAVLGLSIITLGIYGVYWTYTIHRELRDIGRAGGDAELGSLNPVMSTLSLTIGSLIIVPPFVTSWRLGGRVRRAQELSGSGDRIGQLNTFLLLVPGSILWIPAIYWVFHVTRNQNSALAASSAGVAPTMPIDVSEVATQAPASAPPPSAAPAQPSAPAPPAQPGMTSGDPLA